MSPAGDQLGDERNRFPRVSGDEPQVRDGDADLAKFSPRERG